MTGSSIAVPVAASEPLVRIRPGQSLDGVIMEAAATLGLSSTWRLVRDAGARFPNLSRCSMTPSQLEVLADETGVDAEELVARAWPEIAGTTRRTFFGIEVETGLIEKEARRFSPASIAEDPYHRALWQLRCFPYCEETMTYLTDRCAACDRRQRWASGYGVDLCDECGRPLSEQTAKAVPPHDHDDLRLAVGLAHHDPARRARSLAALPSTIAERGAGAALAIVCALAGLVDPATRGEKGFDLPHRHVVPEAMTAAVAAAFRLATGWPHSVVRLADERIALRTASMGDGNGGGTIDFLQLQDRLPIQRGVREAISEVGDIIRRRQPEWLDLPAMQSASGLPATQIAAARRRGRLTAVYGEAFKGPQPLYMPEEAATIARALRDSVPFAQVAVRFGCTYHAIEELVLTGGVEEAALAADWSPSARRRVSPSSVDAFEASMLARAVERTDEFAIRLPIAMTAIGGRLKPWSTVFVHARDGRIPFAVENGVGPLAARMRVRQSDVPAIVACERPPVDDARLAALMSKKDARTTLNIRVTSSVGVLARWPSMKGDAPTVPIPDLLRLASELVFLGEIAALRGKSGSALGRRIRAMGMRPGEAGSYDRRLVAESGLLQPLAAPEPRIRQRRVGGDPIGVGTSPIDGSVQDGRS